jgi:hypothetical protein
MGSLLLGQILYEALVGAELASISKCDSRNAIRRSYAVDDLIGHDDVVARAECVFLNGTRLALHVGTSSA